MQTCFRQHPEIYGAELEEEDDDAPLDATDAPTPATAATSPASQPAPPAPETDAATTDTERAQAAKRQVESEHGEPTSESDVLVPKAAHDAAGAGGGK